jgi:hypothetical protein
VDNPENVLGKPDFRIGRLALWVQGWEREEAANVHDANWLRITAWYAAKGARVLLSGGSLMTFDLEKWLEQLGGLELRRGGTAVLAPIEPHLRVELTAESLGHLALEVEITPDPATQEHRFREELDPSILPERIRELAEICRKFPVRNP